MPVAVSGEGGHRATFAVAVVLIHGFALSEAEAWPILRAHNARCQPPWCDRELHHKLACAGRLTRHPKARGHLCSNAPRIDGRQGTVAPTSSTALPLDGPILDHSVGARVPSRPTCLPPVAPFQFVNPATLPPPPEERPSDERVEDPEDAEFIAAVRRVFRVSCESFY